MSMALLTSGDSRTRTFLETSKAMIETVRHGEANFCKLVFNEHTELNSAPGRTKTDKTKLLVFFMEQSRNGCWGALLLFAKFSTVD